MAEIEAERAEVEAKKKELQDTIRSVQDESTGAMQVGGGAADGCLCLTDGWRSGVDGTVLAGNQGLLRLFFLQGNPQ